MGRPKGPAKDPFESLPEDWKNTASALGKQEIFALIAKVTKNEVTNQLALSNDLQVQEAKALYDDLVAPYKKRTRDNTLAQRVAMAREDDVNLTAAVQLEAENQFEKTLDDAVDSQKMALADSKAQYTETSKANALKVKFLLRCLSDKA